MRSLLLTTGTKVVTAVPRAALQVAGTAWDVGEATVGKAAGKVVGKVLHRGPEQSTGAPRPAAVPSPTREDVPEAEAPKGVPTPKREEAQAAQQAEPVQLAPDVTVDEPAPAHDDLPLPDFDHLTVGSLRSRLRTLDLVQLRQLHAYETAHADRLPVTTLLANRIAKLEKEHEPANA